MDSPLERALNGIAAAEKAVAQDPPSRISPAYAALIRAVEALPENQDGADKSWVWPTYEFCRRHFREFRLV